MRVHTAHYHPARDGDAELFLRGLPEQADVVLGFGAYSLCNEDHGLFMALRRRWPDAQILGCSTAGEIYGAEISDGGLSLATLQLDHSRVRRASAAVGGPEGSYVAGRIVAEQLAAPDLRCVLLLSSGLAVNHSAIVAGLREHLPAGTVLAGGFAGDDARFADTWVLDDGRPQRDRLTAVGFYGEHIAMRHGCENGMEVFSAERVVTRSRDNVLFELDGRPALQVYKEYLGPFAADLPGSGLLFPFSMRADADAPKSLIRSVIAVDEAQQSMTVIGDIPTGHRVRLMRANFDKVVAAAGLAASAAALPADCVGDSLSVVVSCVGRRLVLGDRTEEETEAALEHGPTGAQQIGFYSFGEIVPHINAVCDLHNQTITVTTLSELA